MIFPLIPIPFGRMLMSFEGWQFKLEIHNRSKEIQRLCPGGESGLRSPAQ